MVGDIRDDFLTNERSVRRDLDVAELGRRLGRQRNWLIGPALVCFVASLVFVNVVSPRYTGESKILIENQENYFSRDKADALNAPLPDDEAVQSQVQLISSRDIARAAIKQLGLQGNPEFDPLADGIGPVTRVLVLLGLERDPLRVPPEERILTRYFDRLTVFPVTKSRVLSVEFESSDPELAARAANTISDLYLDVQSSAKRDAARTAADSLRSLVADLRARAADAEGKAQALRSETGLVTGANNTAISSVQLSDMSQQLAQAKSAQADAQAKAKLIRDMIKGGRSIEVADVATGDLLKRLAEQRATVKTEIALQSRTLLPGHPRMQELSAQLSDLESQIKTAADKAARSLETDAHVAAARVDNLETAMSAQKAAIGATGTDQVRLNELDLNAKLLKDQLELNTAKYQDAVARENATSTPADARIISRAVAPQLPTFPKKVPIVILATIAGALFSLGILIAREFLSGRAFEDGEAERVLPVELAAGDGLGEGYAPVRSSKLAEATLRPGIIPDEQEARVVGADPLAALVDDILARKAPDEALRLLVCDIEPGHSGQALAVRIGRVLSRSFRSIVVELGQHSGDPQISVLRGLVGPSHEGTTGLGDLLAGSASFAEVIHRDSVSRLHVVTAGTPEADRDLDGFSNVLDALAQTYDFVILAAPAIGRHRPAEIELDHSDLVVLLPDLTTPSKVVEEIRVELTRSREDGLAIVVADPLEPSAAEPPRFGVAAA